MASEGEGDLQAVIETARESGKKARRRAAEHEVSYRRWKLVGTGLNVGAAVFASAAGATLLSSAKPGSAWAIIAGVLGLLSAVFIAAAAQLGANNEAQDHHRAAANYAALANRFFDLAEIPPEVEKAHAELVRLLDRSAELSRDSPIVEGYARRRVTDRLDAGQLEFHAPGPPGDAVAE